LANTKAQSGGTDRGLPSGEAKATVLLGSANRDPRRREGPDRYDISRETIGNHLGFGVADHNCVGQMIATLEADAVLTARIPGAKSLELTAEPTCRPIHQMRMLGRLRA
jgi:4-methoxybenzoate monooxygenase (O-demethylating)